MNRAMTVLLTTSYLGRRTMQCMAGSILKFELAWVSLRIPTCLVSYCIISVFPGGGRRATINKSDSATVVIFDLGINGGDSADDIHISVILSPIHNCKRKRENG